MSEKPPPKKIELDSSEWRGEPKKKEEVKQIEYKPEGRLLEDIKRVEKPPLEPLTDQAVIVREDTLPVAPEALNVEMVEEPLLTARELIVRKLEQEKLTAETSPDVSEILKNQKVLEVAKSEAGPSAAPSENVRAGEEASGMLSSEGAVMTPEQKERLAKIAGIETTVHTIYEAMTLEERRRYDALDEQPLSSTEKDGTRREWSRKLKSTVESAVDVLFTKDKKEKQESSSRGEKLKEYLSELSESAKENAEEYGPKIAEYIASTADRYNKLGWKKKLFIAGSLMAGASLTAGALPFISGALTVGLYAQRALGAVSLGMNKRRELDAEIAMDASHRFAGKSESEKNKYAAWKAARYFAFTSAAVALGMYEFKELIHSDLLPNALQKAQTLASDGLEKLHSANQGVTRWLADHLPGHSSVTESVVTSPVPATETPPTISSEYAPTSDLDAEANAELSYRKGELPPDFEGRFVYDPNGSEYARGLAQQSLIKDLGPDDLADLNNKIAGMTPRERDFFEKYTADFSRMSGGIPQAPDSELTPTMDAPLAERPVMLDPSRLPGAESGPTPTEAESLHPLDDSPATPDVGTAEHAQKAPAPELGEAPFGRDPIDGHPMNAQEAQKLADLRTAMHDPRQTGIWPGPPPEEKNFFEKLFGASDQTTNAHPTPPPETAQVAPVPEYPQQSAGDTPTGDSSESPVDTTNDEATPNAEDTLSDVNESGLFVPTHETHIYADSGDRLFVYGGTNVDRANAVLNYLKENPKSTVYSADDNGAVRIPWFLRGGEITPGEPIHTGGFLGFGAEPAPAPQPDEFVKVIK